MPGPEDILQQMLQQNPVVRNNPNNAPILNALERRDAQSGQQLAQNYINTLGMDWNTALQQAKAFLREVQGNKQQPTKQHKEEL